jgi:hypothetical protein
VAALAASLNARTVTLLKTKWMPLASEVKNRHTALHQPFSGQV